MSPQFVDFNADGRLDIVAATFDGSPYVAVGTEKGFKEPVMVMDAKGERILINQFWNYDTKKWDTTTRCDPKGMVLPAGLHATSCYAFDWDADGDLDLLLGDHNKGYLFRRMNNGTASEPKFASTNIPVMAGEQAMVVSGTVTTPIMVDWDRDGLMDLLVGSMGDAYGAGPGGAVYLYRNVGVEGSPAFGASPTVLVAPSPKGAGEATRPDSGLHPDLVDFDGDGDLDLLVGGYSHYAPKVRALSEAEQARVKELQAQLAAVTQKSLALSKLMTEATKGMSAEEAAKKRAEFLKEHQAEYAAISAERIKISTEMNALVPTAKREPYVWFYENTSNRVSVGPVAAADKPAPAKAPEAAAETPAASASK